jgi:protein phosphatase
MTMPEKEWQCNSQTASHLCLLPTLPFYITCHSRASEKHPQINEDCIFVDEQTCLAAIFDGVGGRGTGTVATRIAVQAIQNNWNSTLIEAQGATIHDDMSRRNHLHSLIKAVNAQIYAAGEKYSKNEAPAKTTSKPPSATAAFVQLYRSEENSYSMTYAHVGDCRIYLLRKKERFCRLTEDEGYCQFLARKGEIAQDEIMNIDQATSSEVLSEKEIYIFQRRNKIIQALGWKGEITAQIEQQTLSPGDCILLCTDGIHDNLTDHEIKILLKGGNPEQIAEDIVNAALQCACKEGYLRAKHDDMSAIIIGYLDQQ